MKVDLFDTHCHVQSIGATEDSLAEKWYKGGVESLQAVVEEAREAGVSRLLCVGTSLNDSELAVSVANDVDSCWASVGAHPHDAQKYVNSIDKLQIFRKLADDSRVVAIGEVGLDYYYENSDRDSQKRLLEQFLQLASDKDLPVIFHIREAHQDFWSIFDNFRNLRGVLHSFSAGKAELEMALERGLHVGLNGIMTFTKDEAQLEAAKAVPVSKLLLETDSPFLTPTPYRGKVCKPEHVALTAKFLSELRGESLESLADATKKNACNLFNIKQ